jgi:peroxiredoxin (alkyl hydroperoxide reductase subunit C)
MPRIGDVAPDFTAPTTHGDLSFHTWKESAWTILFSHPADFTPVCSTELTEFARRSDEFAARNTKLIGISIDSIHSHLAWVENLRQIMGIRLPFPMIADLRTDVAQKYGMIHPNESSTVTVRALFVIDPKNVIRTIIYYPLNVGRNVDEVVRNLDALQTADKNAVACPVNWQPGQQVIVPAPRTVAQVDERNAMEGVNRLDFYLVKKSL